MLNRKVLVVDDEPDVLEILSYNLKQEGYEPLLAEDGEKALSLAQQHQPSVIVLDIMMPGIDGLEVCRRLRKLPETRESYIIFLTARSEEFAELAGFEAGADDFLVKPVRPRSLLSRLKALARRAAPLQRLQFPGIEIVPDEYAVHKEGQVIPLSKKEFELLFALASRPYKYFSRDALLDRVWGSDTYVIPRTVDVHIRKLREKIGAGYIETLKGVGYRFVPEPQEEQN
ncbi:MAG: response regulator transcription factor [Bacteroidia bacterium]|nr:response regulator transcription factor [Bacteroidia bacterium]MCX7764944.1 response regulator transcription factor [Bacteroidia bacterium]MDW8057743.1 response regulator transcription factor [Bacteroidia bacterium]